MALAVFALASAGCLIDAQDDQTLGEHTLGLTSVDPGAPDPGDEEDTVSRSAPDSTPSSNDGDNEIGNKGDVDEPDPVPWKGDDQDGSD